MNLEEKANEYMDNSDSSFYDLDSFLKSSFLEWMKARCKRENFVKSIDFNCDKLKEVYETITTNNEISEEKLKESLEKLCLINGVGPVLASAIITLIKPQKYGIVNNYVVTAINRVLKEKIANIPITVNGVIAVEKRLSEEIDTNNTLRCRCRDIDMAL